MARANGLGNIVTLSNLDTLITAAEQVSILHHKLPTSSNEELGILVRKMFSSRDYLGKLWSSLETIYTKLDSMELPSDFKDGNFFSLKRSNFKAPEKRSYILKGLEKPVAFKKITEDVVNEIGIMTPVSIVCPVDTTMQMNNGDTTANDDDQIEVTIENLPLTADNEATDIAYEYQTLQGDGTANNQYDFDHKFEELFYSKLSKEQNLIDNFFKEIEHTECDAFTDY
jgi:hypothetical protein